MENNIAIKSIIDATKSMVLVALFVLISIPSNAQVSTFQWADRIGSILDDYGRGVATDAAGNVYTTGSFWSTVDFDPGPGVYNLTSAGSDDIFVSKVDAAGNFVWAKSMGSNLSDYANGIAVDAAGNVYTTGHFTDTCDFNPGAGVFNVIAFGFGDTFVSKLDAAGNFVWVQQLGGIYVSIGYGIALDPFGNIYTTGYFNGTADFDPSGGTFNLTSAGGRDNFISKLDPAGNFMWAAQIGGLNNDNGVALAFDAAGNVYSTGAFQGTADFDPGVGTYNLTTSSPSDYDIFISKLSSTGNFIWAKQVGSTSLTDGGASIACDASGNSFTTGSFSGTLDFDPSAATYTMTSAGGSDAYILKLDASGNFSWAKKWGGVSGDGCADIALDASGNIYTTGSFYGTTDFDPGAGVSNLSTFGGTNYDVFISKLNAAGNFVWAKQLGGTLNDLATSISVDASNNIYSTGYFNGTADFDPSASVFNLTASAGNPDVYIQKMGQGSTTSVSEGLINSTVSIYPNPTNNILNIEFSNEQLLNKNLSIEIYNTLGQKVVHENVRTNFLQMNTSNLKDGLYVLKIIDSNSTTLAVKKIIKE
jgi:hypothetical protein